jgi:hypothetical protein
MMVRKLLIFSMVLTLGLTMVSCGSPVVSNSSNDQRPVQQTSRTVQNRLSDGTYAVQQATYDDANGEYEVMLLNTAPGESSIYRTANLPMARLTDEEISAGQKSYLKVENGQPSLHLTEDFRIEYVHNVTDTQVNPQTAQSETVVVRRKTGFWAPFAGALAGQALGSLLFRPQYYVPPVFQPGVIVGYGGYGRTYDAAVDRYRQRYQAPPAEVRNRQTFRTTGRLRSPAYRQPTNRRYSRSTERSTGSGYGSSDLRRSPSSNRNYRRSPSRSPFGSARPRSFGSRRR